MTSRLKNISEQRRKKLERLRARGVNPYPHRYEQTHTTQEAVEQLELMESPETSDRARSHVSGQVQEKVSVAGRITAIRRMGKSSFLDIRDSSGKIQLLFQNTEQLKADTLELFKDLDIGDIIGVKGKLLRTKTGEPTIRVSAFTMLAK